MDSETIILTSLLAASLSWWLAILIKEEVRLVKQYKIDEIDSIERAERVRLLSRK